MDPYTTDPVIHWWLMGIALVVTVISGFYAASARMLLARIIALVLGLYSTAWFVWLAYVVVSHELVRGN